MASFDIALKNGEWKVLGNCNIPKNIVIPNFKTEILEGFKIINYNGEILRDASIDEEVNLNYRESFSPALLEDAIKAKYGIEEWDEDFDSIVYKQ